MANYQIETKCVQSGYRPGNGEPREVPIIQSTTFKYATSADMGKLFDLEASGYFYTRLQNPTNDYVAAKIADMEGGTAGMLTSSGQAANFFAIFNIASQGDHVVACSTIYGGTFNLFNVTMRKMGIDFTFVSPDCTEEELDAAFRPNTKAVFGETIANPALTVLDFEKFANAAHNHGVPLIVDNTFATPVNCRPFEFGADIVTHSTTKYMDGHGAAVGGAIIDSGKFDWLAHADKFPGLTTPDESYHESLHCRMKQHCANGLALATFLKDSPKVEWVSYPSLPGDRYYERAMKYLPGGSCGVVSFGVKGGREEAEAFMGRLKIFAIETHVADARSCCLHPASSTHRQLSEQELIDCGISGNLVRMSCGLENTDDLIADVAEALG